MADVEVLTYGFSFGSDQGSFGLATNALLTVGNETIVVDTGPSSRRSWLYNALESKNMTPEDIDVVILTHMHWDHCQNTDMFRNARILVHPAELDYARNPNRADFAVAQYMADMVDKMKVELVSEGDRVAEGISIVETPGHTIGHISVAVSAGGENVLIAGDALPDSGSVARGLPTNVFYDVEDARTSVEKMVASAQIFYPGHDRPFRLDKDQISYLEGPFNIEVTNSTEGLGETSLTFKVLAARPVNINIVQK
jgi:glyoxylase-like metal-dependent hydrolase (beta-lactamase superfamily II)